MNRKGQLQQVFIYVMAIIVIGFIVLFGFRMINGLFGKQCDAEMATFSSELERYFSSATRNGATKHVYINKPCDFDTLCFVDADYVSDSNSLDVSGTDYPILEANTKDNFDYNIYLIKRGSPPTEEPFAYESKLQLNTGGDGYLCIESQQGAFDFWLLGLGGNGFCLYTDDITPACS